MRRIHAVALGILSVTIVAVSIAVPAIGANGGGFIDSEPGSWNMSPQALERAFAWAQRSARKAIFSSVPRN